MKLREPWLPVPQSPSTYPTTPPPGLRRGALGQPQFRYIILQLVRLARADIPRRIVHPVAGADEAGLVRPALPADALPHLRQATRRGRQNRAGLLPAKEGDDVPAPGDEAPLAVGEVRGAARRVLKGALGVIQLVRVQVHAPGAAVVLLVQEVLRVGRRRLDAAALLEVGGDGAG
ncbi:hypothetical protein PG991_012297 [Apiospora marii]|uniref:Uncharacterized protein n=1 Tax=Apiospora marii TaxID=335849 RepID=A0ABR1R998_9PEZI